MYHFLTRGRFGEKLHLVLGLNSWNIQYTFKNLKFLRHHALAVFHTKFGTSLEIGDDGLTTYRDPLLG